MPSWISNLSNPFAPLVNTPAAATATTAVVIASTGAIAARNNSTHNNLTLQAKYDKLLTQKVLPPPVYTRNSIVHCGASTEHVEDMLRANFGALTRAQRREYKEFDFRDNNRQLTHKTTLSQTLTGSGGEIKVVDRGQPTTPLPSSPRTASIQDSISHLMSSGNHSESVFDSGEVVMYSKPVDTRTTYCSQSAPRPAYVVPSTSIDFLDSPLGLLCIFIGSGTLYTLIYLFIQKRVAFFLENRKKDIAVEKFASDKSLSDKVDTLIAKYESYQPKTLSDQSAVESQKPTVCFFVNEPSSLEILTFYKTQKLSLNQAVFVLTQVHAVTITAKVARQFLLDDLENFAE